MSGGDRRGCSVTPPRAGRGRIAPEGTEFEAGMPLSPVLRAFGTFFGVSKGDLLCGAKKGTKPSKENPRLLAEAGKNVIV